MHVLICSYEFDLGSEGICTGRLVRALLDAGCEITIVTSPGARTTFLHDRLHYCVISPAPFRPAKFFFYLAPLLGHIPTRHGYIWSRRVARLRLKRRPDFVYGRAHPFQSVAAAHGLASRLRLPLWTHFSDPMPSPYWGKTHPEYERTLLGVRRLVSESKVMTLTTRPALAFQETLIGEKLGTKAFVLNHVAPEPAFLARRQPGSKRTFAYFGMFYGKRNATALLQGFRQHFLLHPDDQMLFVGTEPHSVLAEAARLGIAASVRVMGRVDDVRTVMAKVDVLIASDSFSTPQVFLSTKLVEYLVVNRPVVLISEEQSPGAQLLAHFPQTTIVVTSEEPAAVSAGLAKSDACAADDVVYQRRFAQMEAFSPTTVAARFLDEARARNT